MDENKEQGRPTMVDGVPTGGTTDSGNPDHDKKGMFTGKDTSSVSNVVPENQKPVIEEPETNNKKEKCIELKDSTTKRTGANKVCYDAAELNNINMPNSMDEALRLFNLSCGVEHEPTHKGVNNSFDDTVVQPYIQEHILPKLLQKLWNKGVQCACVFNPYNKYDIAGCDYWFFFKDDDGSIKRIAVDAKSNLTAMDKHHHGKEQGSKFVISHYDMNTGVKKPGWFAKEKITDVYLFSTMYSNRTNDKKLVSNEQIDSSKNIFVSKEEFIEELKLRTDFEGDDKEFTEFLNNKSKLLQDYAYSLINNQPVQNIDKSLFNESRYKDKSGNTKIKSISMSLGTNSEFVMKMDVYPDGKTQTYLDVDKMDDVGSTIEDFTNDNKFVSFEENGGLVKHSKSVVKQNRI